MSICPRLGPPGSDILQGCGQGYGAHQFGFDVGVDICIQTSHLFGILLNLLLSLFLFICHGPHLGVQLLNEARNEPAKVGPQVSRALHATAISRCAAEIGPQSVHVRLPTGTEAMLGPAEQTNLGSDFIRVVTSTFFSGSRLAAPG